MNTIHLENLNLKTFTEQNTEDYCLLNNINPDNITELFLYENELTDISGVKLFKNLEYLNLFNNKITDILILKNLNKLETLYLSDNKLTDISVIQYLNNLIILGIRNLRLESDQFKYIKSLKNLKRLWSRNGFKNMSVLKQLNKNIELW